MNHLRITMKGSWVFKKEQHWKLYSDYSILNTTQMNMLNKEKRMQLERSSCQHVLWFSWLFLFHGPVQFQNLRQNWIQYCYQRTAHELQSEAHFKGCGNQCVSTRQDSMHIHILFFLYTKGLGFLFGATWFAVKSTGKQNKTSVTLLLYLDENVTPLTSRGR